MPCSSFDLSVPLLQPLLAFLKNALAAQRKNNPEARSIWLEAASHLYDLDHGSIGSLAVTLGQQQRHAEAVALTSAMAELQPDNAQANFNLGYALQVAGRNHDALEPYRRALAIDADLAQLRNNLAVALRMAGGDLTEEIRLLESAIKANPQDSNPWINLAGVRRLALDLDGALHAGAMSLQIAPDSPLALNNYALALKEAQRWDEAERYTKAALERCPDDASLRFNLATLQLLQGNCDEGWQLHEARWHGSSEMRGNRPTFSRPQWQGEPLDGKTLLVWGEQGMGDLLQFSRYIPALAARVHNEGGRVVWNTYPQMQALLHRSLGAHVDEYACGGDLDSLPSFDYEIALLSVPLALGTGAETFASAVPYLRPDPAASAVWRDRLNAEKRFKVGLTWTGSAGHQRNAFRSVGWERYARGLQDIDGVAFYSLQPGAANDVAAMRAAGLAVTDYTDLLTSFDDTAAFVGELDLVITVCTSVAHLSGAIGQKTWVLLDTNPHWPWLLNRSDSCWYPTATLYRQPTFGRWGPVLDQVAQDLSALASRSNPPAR